MTLMERRRALMGAKSEPPIPPNKFVEGSYTKGSSAWTVDATGNVTLTAWNAGTNNRPAITMIRKIDFAVGDEIRLVVTKLSGTLSVAQFVDVWICGEKILSNESWGKGTTAIDKTITASVAATSVYFIISNRTGNATISNYKFKVEVYVNGTKAFPEV